METHPYSIYVDHRPFRIAFLVNPADGLDWFDAIFKYNNGKWGGRFNAIFFTDGQTIDEKWWNFLREYDPDIVKTTVTLSEELEKRIHTFLSPLAIEQVDPGHKFISLRDDPLDILPTKKNVSTVARDYLRDESSLVLFEVDETTPEIIKLFLNRSFGLIKDRERFYTHLELALEECSLKTYKVTDFASLNTALLDLGEFRNRVVFPIQICSLPNTFKDTQYSHLTEKFAVIIGDSIQELTYFWNRPLIIRNWMRTYFTQLWVPEEIISNDEVHAGLGKFINRYTGQTGNNDHHGAHFVSFTLPEDRLRTIADSFRENFWHPRTVAHLTEPQIPEYGQRAPFLMLKRGLDFYRAHSTEEHLVLTEPTVKQGGMGGQHWFTDVYIQYRPEKFLNIHGKDYWWKLPRRNDILRETGFFNRAARINEHGMFSVLMSRAHEFDQEANHLVVKLPEDRGVFHTLLCGPAFDCTDMGRGRRFNTKPFYHMQRSDQGQYLDGVLSLFPDLLNAHSIFEERFWRNVFQKMSNQSDVQDAQKKTEITNTLKKAIDRGRDFKESDEDLEWLAGKVLVYSKNHARQEVDLSFKELSDEAQAETDAYNANPSGQVIPYDPEELKRSISTLMNWKVLSAGVRPKCPKCGYRIWYSVDELSQKIDCRGCGYNFTLAAEESWYYRLNSLVRAAVSVHGTVPVLMVLGQLMSDSRSSFLYQPSMELMNRAGDNEYTIEAEVDLLCIKDGEFIIGEIKRSAGLFDQGDFDKIERLARAVKPDQILFSSLDKQPNRFVNQNIERLRTSLADLEIKVDWYPIRYWAFDPRPVR